MGRELGAPDPTCENKSFARSERLGGPKVGVDAAADHLGDTAHMVPVPVRHEDNTDAGLRIFADLVEVRECWLSLTTLVAA